ncbi:MAG TPA: hypothetical protein VF432_15815 [Thermoanaerobaculia bacterium]
MTGPIRYVADLAHVREVTLVCAADLAYWRGRLRRERLEPLDVGGRAEVLVVAAEGVFRGIAFRELSFSVTVADDEAYLFEAYNSNRFFAWSERAFFSTPYQHGRVGVRTDPAAITVSGRAIAEMASARRGTVAPEEWRGVLHLARGRFFHAILAGETERIAVSSADRFAVDGMEPQEWRIRRDAWHAKSKTFPAAGR